MCVCVCVCVFVCVSNLCDLETSKWSGLGSSWAVGPQKKKMALRSTIVKLSKREILMKYKKNNF